MDLLVKGRGQSAEAHLCFRAFGPMPRNPRVRAMPAASKYMLGTASSSRGSGHAWIVQQQGGEADLVLPSRLLAEQAVPAPRSDTERRSFDFVLSLLSGIVQSERQRAVTVSTTSIPSSRPVQGGSEYS